MGLSRRSRAHTRALVLGLYALVALVAPLLHHDFTCHLQSRVHCDACTASPTAHEVEAGVTPFVHRGLLEPMAVESLEAKASAVRPSSPGRAPPTNFISA